MPKWEEIRDDLFEAIMAVQPALGKEQQEQVVVFMQSRGHNMVWNAIRQHLQKLRRKEGGAANGVNSGNDEAATPNKKGKRGPAAGAKKEKTPKRKPTKNAAPKDEDDSEDDLNYGPAPKKIKVENRDLIDDDDGDLPPLSGDV